MGRAATNCIVAKAALTEEFQPAVCSGRLFKQLTRMTVCGARTSAKYLGKIIKYLGKVFEHISPVAPELIDHFRLCFVRQVELATGAIPLELHRNTLEVQRVFRGKQNEHQAPRAIQFKVLAHMVEGFVVSPFYDVEPTAFARVDFRTHDLSVGSRKQPSAGDLRI